MALHFSKRALKTKRQWSKAFKNPKEKNFQPNCLYWTKLPLKCRGKILKIFIFVFFLVIFVSFSVKCLYKCFGPFFYIFFFRSFLCILDTKSLVIYIAWGSRINHWNRIECRNRNMDTWYIRELALCQQRKNKLFKKN